MSTLLLRSSMRKYAWLVLLCSILGAFFYIFIYYSGSGTIPSPREHGLQYSAAMLIVTLLGVLVLFIDQQLDKFIHWKSNFLARFMAGLAGNFLIALLFTTLAGKYWVRLTEEEVLKVNILFVITIFIYEIFYGLFYSYRYYAITQAEQLRSDRWQLELQFESLKSQISPHYLFNCLNTVSSLVYRDTRLAEEFIRRMADTFRYVLTHQTRKLISLREELEFVKSYYFLLQVRYEYHLKLEINVPQNVLDTQVPPMTLQLLVENAVKHNAISKDQPLLVYISARDNTHVIVTNSKTSSVKPTTSFRVGLENIHKRYSFFSDEKVIVRDEEKFSVQLPVLKDQLPVPS